MWSAAFVLARFECLKVLATRRGWMALLALALVWLLVMQMAILPAARWFETAEASGAAAIVLDALGLASLGRWPVPALAVYWLVALHLLPLFALTIAADQMASDRARGTLRYLTLRATRLQIFAGRFIGQAFIMMVLTVVTLASVLIVVAVDAPAALTAALAMAPWIVLQVTIALLPWIALMALCSLLARSARQATLLAVVFYIVSALLVGWLRGQWAMPATLALALEALVPGAQTAALLRRLPGESAQLMIVPVIQSGLLLVLGAVAMRRIRL